MTDLTKALTTSIHWNDSAQIAVKTILIVFLSTHINTASVQTDACLEALPAVCEAFTGSNIYEN